MRAMYFKEILVFNTQNIETGPWVTLCDYLLILLYENRGIILLYRISTAR